MTTVYIYDYSLGISKALSEYAKGDDTLVVSKNENGKPYICGNSDINISISHSGDCIAVALGDVKVGVDIERQKPRNLISVGKRYFDKEEFSLDSLELLRLWTAKEAYSKYLGESLKLSHLATNIDGLIEKGIQFTTKKIFFHDEEYFCTVCGELNVEFCISNAII